MSNLLDKSLKVNRIAVPRHYSYVLYDSCRQFLVKLYVFLQGVIIPCVIAEDDVGDGSGVVFDEHLNDRKTRFFLDFRVKNLLYQPGLRFECWFDRHLQPQLIVYDKDSFAHFVM